MIITKQGLAANNRMPAIMNRPRIIQSYLCIIRITQSRTPSPKTAPGGFFNLATPKSSKFYRVWEVSVWRVTSREEKQISYVKMRDIRTRAVSLNGIVGGKYG